MILCYKSPSKGRHTINHTLNPTSVSVFEDILGIIIAAPHQGLVKSDYILSREKIS